MNIFLTLTLITSCSFSLLLDILLFMPQFYETGAYGTLKTKSWSNTLVFSVLNIRMFINIVIFVCVFVQFLTDKH